MVGDEEDRIRQLFSELSEKKWTVREHVGSCPPISLDPAFELVSFLEENEPQITGELLVFRARFTLDARLGLEHAVYLLGHQERIPADSPKNLLFPGTIWYNSDGEQYILYLQRQDDRWCQALASLDRHFDSDDALVRIRA